MVRHVRLPSNRRAEHIIAMPAVKRRRPVVWMSAEELLRLNIPEARRAETRRKLLAPLFVRMRIRPASKSA